MSGQERTGSVWVELYVWGFSLIGVIILILSIQHIAPNQLGIGMLSLLAGVSELVSVELFSSSRNSRVSVSSIVALAGIMIYGPFAGVIVHGFSGLITMVPNTLLTKLPKKGRGPALRRGLFNMGMFVLSAYLAGLAYLYLGGNFEVILSQSNILPLIGATLVDTIANVLILVGILSLQTCKPALEIWQQNFQWSMPISILGGVIGSAALAIAHQFAGLLGVVIFFLPVLSIGYSFRIYANNSRNFIEQLEQLNLDLTDSNQRLKTTNRELMQTLAGVVDAYDDYTFGHSTHVSSLAVAIAQEMGIKAKAVRAIEQAGLLHDIGKVGITDAIINKPGPLTDDEYEIVKRHPVIGAEIVQRMSNLQPLVPIIKHHHERWDGSGYPDHLKGEWIPQEARILALADAVDTMCSTRPYRPSRTPEAVLKEAQRCSGTHFDPETVAALERIIARNGYAFLAESEATRPLPTKNDHRPQMLARAHQFSQPGTADSPSAGAVK